jgi:hypothetical protein
VGFHPDDKHTPRRLEQNDRSNRLLAVSVYSTHSVFEDNIVSDSVLFAGQFALNDRIRAQVKQYFEHVT